VSGTLAGRRILLTGGTHGIGLATAVAAAQEGASLVVAYRDDEQRAEELRRLLRKEGDTHRVVRADVTDEDGAACLADECRSAFGGLDVVVNNVGVDGRAPFGDLTVPEWTRVMNANLTSAFLVTRAAVPLLAEGGSVVHVGASAALRGRPQSAHYGASKSALIGLARSLAKELGPSGIRVNVVAPGVIVTDPGGGPPPPVAEIIAGMTGLRRLGTPEDVVGPILFFAGTGSRYVSGSVLHVDGGI
jgi:3-oxoacyl-[acyl-carrier protein] reductase